MKMSSKRKQLLKDRHAKLLAAQRQKSPALTIREMMEVLGVHSESTVVNMLNNMVREGLVTMEPIGTGRKNLYRFVERVT